MDPRHPEIILPRIKELVAHYERVEDDIKRATTASQLGQLEREGGLVVQEILLTSPRLHESMINISRQRRSDIAKGVLIEPQDTAVEMPTPEQTVEKKPKTSTKKKKAKK